MYNYNSHKNYRNVCGGIDYDRIENERMDKSLSNEPKPIEPVEAGEIYVYKRKEKGWEPFLCMCGSSKQLSPSNSIKEFRCTRCGRRIVVVS